MSIEMLDYGITIDSHETVNYFRNFPDRGSIGYLSFEDAEADRNPLGNIEKYLDIVEDFISAGLIGDHYIFTNGQVSEIISEYEKWDWTPETGIVPWNSEIDPEPDVCLNRKSRRAIRINRNKRKKGSDRAHGKHAHDVRKAIWEDTADWDDMPNNTYFRWDEKRKTFTSPKKPKVHRVKRTFRDRQNAAFRDRLTDITPIERLTASVLAEVKQYHGMVGCTWNVFYLTEAICQREQLPYPDYAYVQEYEKTVKLVLEYFDSYEDEDYSTHEYIDLRA